MAVLMLLAAARGLGEPASLSPQSQRGSVQRSLPADIDTEARYLFYLHGRIIEEGTHDGLMAEGGHYAELYNTYFRHQSLEYIESLVELAPV